MKYVLIFCVVNIFFASVDAQRRPGGWGEEEPANSRLQGYADQLRREIEDRAGVHYQIFQVFAYRAQVVAGLNYHVKIKVGEDDNEYIHVRMFKPLFGAVSLTSVEFGKSRCDVIET